MAWTFEATKAGYGNMWRSISIKPGKDSAAASRFAKIIIENEARYRGVQSKTGVPWFFIGALHMRESGCDFAGVLHNGEKIIGKGKLTRLVPKNRGPFSSWESAADDALRLKNLHKIKDWSIERMGFESERFNGLGYTGKGVNSPYVWAGSNHEQTGKYVADHVWDRNFDDPQIGTMTLIKRLCELRPDIEAAVNAKFVPPPPDAEENEPKETKPAAKSKTILAAIFAAIMASLGEFVSALADWKWFLTLVVLLALAYIIWERNGKPDIRGWLR